MLTFWVVAIGVVTGLLALTVGVLAWVFMEWMKATIDRVNQAEAHASNVSTQLYQVRRALRGDEPGESRVKEQGMTLLEAAVRAARGESVSYEDVICCEHDCAMRER